MRVIRTKDGNSDNKHPMFTAIIFEHESSSLIINTNTFNFPHDVTKCSKLKWNHEPQASGFTAKFLCHHFYGL